MKRVPSPSPPLSADVAYKEVRLANDLIGSRGYTLDRGDDAWTDCRVASTTRTRGDAYEVDLRRRGGIRDAYRVVRPTGVSYAVSYRVTGEATTQTAIDGYPFAPRDELREAPWREANGTTAAARRPPDVP